MIQGPSTISSRRFYKHALWSRFLLFTLDITGLKVQLKRLPCKGTFISVKSIVLRFNSLAVQSYRDFNVKLNFHSSTDFSSATSLLCIQSTYALKCLMEKEVRINLPCRLSSRSLTEAIDRISNEALYWVSK